MHRDLLAGLRLFPVRQRGELGFTQMHLRSPRTRIETLRSPG
jgi:hypothetical protein